MAHKYMEQEASAGTERYSAKYVRQITDRLATVIRCWQARDFVDYWVEKEVWPIMKRFEEETERNVRERLGQGEPDSKE